MLMKNSWKKLILTLTLGAALASTASAQTRIATVDLSKLFTKYWKTEQATKALEERKGDLVKELDSFKDEQKKLLEQYQKLNAEANDQAVSSEERDKRKKAAEAKLKELREGDENIKQFTARSDTDLKEQFKRMRAKVLEEITETVNAKAKAGGYSLVVDTAAETINGTRVFLYSNGETDLTIAVLEQLNAAAPLEATKPVAKPADAKEKK
ncbi:MAG: OmpH family outer membrane protein [Verrucomicrobia subdivision 3 bacterium]|nr:OmpH family outer membrane protein [Limisphaerales bacterium]